MGSRRRVWGAVLLVAGMCGVMGERASGQSGSLPAAAQTPSPTYGRQPPAIRGIAVDTRAAALLGLTIGAHVQLSASPDSLGETVTVAAITERRADPAEVARQELHVRLHLDHLQGLLALDDRVDRFAIATRGARGRTATDAVTSAINDVAFGFRAHRSRDVAVTSSRTFRVVERFHRAIAIITVVASAAFLLCLLLLTVEERRRDIATLRMTGISRRTIVSAIVIEAAIVSLVGSAMGVGVGGVCSQLVNRHFQRVYQTPLTFALVTPEIIGFAVSLSLTLGIAAGAVAAWRLVRVPPLALLGR